MIAFALVSVLLATLMGFYRQLNVLQTETDQLRRRTFQLRYLQSRLADVLPRALAPKKKLPKDEIPDNFFYVSTQEEQGLFSAPSLVFTYDNQKDLVPDFCNGVLGRLYRVVKDGKSQLWLATWPRPSCSTNASRVRRELLLDEVAKLDFDFYEPPLTETAATPTPSPEGAPAEPVEIPTPGAWQKIWPMSYQQLPAIIKVEIQLTPKRGKAEGETFTYYFPFPNSEKPIIMVQ